MSPTSDFRWTPANMYKTRTSGIAETVEETGICKGSGSVRNAPLDETGKCKGSGRVCSDSLPASLVAASGSLETIEPIRVCAACGGVCQAGHSNVG